MRLKTPIVKVRDVEMGGNHPIVIQSMTNTDTADAQLTANQCIELADAGSEIVRITVNDEKAAQAVMEIRKILDDRGYSHLPIVGDFHYNGHTLLTDYPKCALTLDKYRINPGNIDYGSRENKNFETIVKVAIENDKPVRIGANWGSIDQRLLTEMMDKNSNIAKPKSDKEVIIDTLVKSALRSAENAEKLGLKNNKIVLSVKMSDVQDVISAYELLNQRMLNHPYVLHLGLTEAGSGMQGLIASSAVLAILLNQGIGDTIRISLTPKPGEPRTKEVEACKTLLQAMGYRHFKPQVTSCPGCGRTESAFFQDLAKDVNQYISIKMSEWQKKYPRVTEMRVAVMGCTVNGPGESKHADIAISLPGKMEEPVAPTYIRGKFHKNLTGEKIPEQFIELLENFIKTCYC